ncbi:protein SOSEKI 1 [Andrographis paniculata]|uniref:protein SOSEKI 1 n=1 Tax=Andrographis paniculata TaxID=175694 RepID=UPI0021E7A2C8|nr:protein SOSEKI 1 [Andrographis paniculata]
MEEMRRVDIVYFLSRKGSIEHPHLIRLHHLSRNGIRLRDVKRWLGEVRGKDMPDSFSWSYKRKYKSGYVWQDLLDDDLITPISDSEYVLKGSEISSTIDPPEADSSYNEKIEQPSSSPCLQEDKKATHKSHNSSDSVSPKSSSQIEESSQTFGSETSTLTEDHDSIKLETASASPAKQEQQRQRPPSFPLPSFPAKNTAKKSDETKGSASSPSSTKSKKGTSSSSSSSIFRSLITCGGVHTHDSAVVPINKPKKPSDRDEANSAEICKRDSSFCGSQSQRVFGTPCWTQQQWNGRKSFDGARNDSSSRTAAYKPAVAGPTCSQCGKTFRPDKMHSHMKSCKGMKAAMSKAAAAANQKQSSEESMEVENKASFSGHSQPR